MRLYGRSIAKRAIFGRIDQRREFSEGILWTIDTVSETCTVKIQGSNEQVRAHYPRNLTTIPSWLRVGNAVKIVHKRGRRDYIEVVSPGRAIPTPVTGEQFPGLSTLPDAVLTPVRVLPFDGYQVEIEPGVQYRINGDTYTLTIAASGQGYTMGVDEDAMGDAGSYPIQEMGKIILDLGAPPATNKFRYDIIVAGTDSQADVIAGTAVTSDPALPAIPSEHVLLEKILRVGGETEVSIYRIGQTWTAPAATKVVAETPDEIPWDPTTQYPESDFKAIVKDQYDRPYDGGGEGWVLSCEFLYGTGKIYSEDSGESETGVSQYTTESEYTFTYTRYQPAEEKPPSMKFTLEGKPRLYVVKPITLLDDAGDPIFG